MVMNKFFAGMIGLIGWSLLASVSQAQVKITGGNGTIPNANIFVPTTGRFIGPTDRGSDVNSNIYGSTFKDVFIKTELGNLPTNLRFRANLVPTFNTQAGEAPIVGTTGKIDGLVSFKALTSSGRPATFNNIPTTLNIQLTQVPCPVCTTPTTEWNAFDYTLTEIGVGSTPSTVTTVTRETPVRLLQYQPTGTNPTDRVVLGNSIPASAYDTQRLGVSYAGDVKFDINSGIFGDGNVSSVRLAEVLTTNPNAPSTDPSSQLPTYTIGYVPIFINSSSQSTTTWYVIPNQVFVPGLGQEVTIVIPGRRTSNDDSNPRPSNNEEDIVYIDRSGSRTYTAIGLPSRVFPNFMGLEEVKLDQDTPNPNPSPSPSPNPSPNPSPSPTPTPDPNPSPTPTPSPSPNIPKS